MMSDRARRHRRHRRLQGGRGRARAAEARPRRRRRDDARRRRGSSARSPSRRSRAAGSSPISSEPGANADIEHIALASTIDLLLVAPATANIIGKFANGIADDFLSTLYIATRAPVLVAPAMNTQMFEHEAVRANLDTLAARGVRFVEPGEGYLACGWIGKGGSPSRTTIVAAAEAILRPRGPAARAARPRHGRADLRGPRSGPLHRQPIERPDGLRDRRRGGAPRRRGDARRRADRRSSRRPCTSSCACAARPRCTRPSWRAPTACDVVIMAAAVADYTPADARRRRWRRRGDTLTLVLKRTPDILGDAGRAPRRVRRRARCSSGSPPRPRTSSRARRPSASGSTSISSSPTTCRAPDAGFDVDDQRRDDRRAGRRGVAAAAVARRALPPTSSTASSSCWPRARRQAARKRRRPLSRIRTWIANNSRNTWSSPPSSASRGVSRDPAWRMREDRSVSRTACGGDTGAVPRAGTCSHSSPENP